MNPVALASGVLPEFGAVAVIEAAARAGFDMTGLWIEPGEWTAADTRAARTALRAAGLPLLDVEVVWLKPDSRDEDHALVLDVGAELGARAVLVVSSEPDDAVTAARLAGLCAQAAGSGMRVALEFGLFTAVKTIGQAVGILARVDHPAAALLVDPLHLARSGGVVGDVAAVAPALLAYAQLCDAPLVGADPADADAIFNEAVDGRLQVGEGGLPLAALLAALPAGLPLGVELRSKALRKAYPEAGKRAAVVARATRGFLDGLRPR